MLVGAQAILTEVKRDVKGSFDIIPDVTLATLQPKDFSSYYQRFGAEKFEKYVNHLDKVEACREVCGDAIKRLNSQGVKFQYERSARDIAVTKFGIGECGEVSNFVHVEAVRRQLLPAIVVAAADKLVLKPPFQVHGFNILGVSKDHFQTLTKKHQYRLVPLLQELHDCVILDVFLGIVGRVEEVRQESSLFMQYHQHQQLSLVYSFTAIENPNPEACDTIAREAQLLSQFIQQNNLLTINTGPASTLSRYVQSKKRSLSDQEVIDVLNIFSSRTVSWKKSPSQEGIFWCQDTLEKISRLQRLFVAANLQPELRKVKDKELHVLKLHHPDVHVIIAVEKLSI